MSFNGKTVWVTGASGAIGGAIAGRFSLEGATVYTKKMDLLDYVGVMIAGKEIHPDILVNCAGVYGPNIAAEKGFAYQWEHAIQVNLTGAYYLTRSVLPLMKERKAGKIIHMSGGGAAYGRPYYSAYSAAKAGLVRFVECVAEEVEGDNIQINAVAPGSVKSRMNPEGTGTPDKAVELALFLASRESDHITGRLISAIHDRWSWSEHITPEAGKLRRIPFSE